MVDEVPVNYQHPVGMVRKFIPDLVQLPDPADMDGEKSFLFSDEDIQAFLFDQSVNPTTPRPWEVKRAAAFAMIALANSENLILKKIVTQDQQTDGPSVAKQLIAAATTLLGRADMEEAAADNVQVIGTEGLIAVYPATPDADRRYYRGYVRGWLR